MPEFKKQHYVPKLLLKLFSYNNDRKHIGIFNPDTETFKVKIPLTDQAQEDYFYGSTGEVEKFLGTIENEVAPVLCNIISNQKLPDKTSDSYLSLYVFVYHLAFRTKTIVDQVEKTVNKSIKEALKYEEQFKGIDFEKFEFKAQNLPGWTVTSMNKQLDLAFDLHPKLLVNKSDTKFIISDNPLVRYNQFMESRKRIGGHLGPFAKGLQLFFPISPDLMIVFYDKWAYEFTKKEYEQIIIKSKYDVDSLNSMQIINCFQTTFFNQNITSEYLSELKDRFLDLRNKDDSNLAEVGRYIDKEGNERVQYHLANSNKNFKLKLSFFKNTKKSSSHVMSNHAVQLRDERVRTILSQRKNEWFGEGVEDDF